MWQLTLTPTRYLGKMACVDTCTPLKILLFLYIIQICLHLNQTQTVPWYENLPAVAMDYKVHIDAGKEDCYYQYVQPGATFYVSFQVGMSFI